MAHTPSKALREEWNYMASEINEGKRANEYVADWWLSKLASSQKSLLEELLGEIGEDINGSIKGGDPWEKTYTNRERSRLRTLIHSKLSQLGDNQK